MGPIVLLCASLLLLFEARGTSAVTPVSVQTGHDLLLHVTEAVDLRKSDLLTWRFNNSKNIARYSDAVTIFTSYLGRAEYFAHNHSLLLRNVQQNDSGDYRAEVSGEDHKAVAEYKVTVQDPVSPVKLAVKHCSPDSSNLTVTCSTLDSLISSTFTCVNQTCSCERGEQSEFTTSAASLHVYLENGSVICNHSNQVSWKKDVKRIEDLCGKSAEFKHLHGNKDVTAIVVSTIILLVTIVAVILYLLYRRRRGKCHQCKPTSGSDPNN
uniref:SLAM family member 5-like isoform X2 n=1 Tax=Semicossyphus pulcher TaxID=241346 RepID=UPI0037E7C701